MMLLSGMKYLNATWVDLTLMHVKLNYVHSDRTTVKRRRVGLWRINLLCRTCVAATRGRQWRVESSFGSRRRSLIRITTASFTSNCSARSVRNANRTLSNTPCGTLRKLLRYVQQSVLQSFFQMHDLFFFNFDIKFLLHFLVQKGHATLSEHAHVLLSIFLP